MQELKRYLVETIQQDALKNCIAAKIKSIDAITYYVYLLITPMSFLSGTFFPLESFSKNFQIATNIFPLIHVVVPMRNLSLGVGVDSTLIWHLGYLVVLSFFMFFLALKLMKGRLVK